MLVAVAVLVAVRVGVAVPTGVFVGGTGVLAGRNRRVLGGTGVLVGGTGVFVGGTGVLVGATTVFVGEGGTQSHAEVDHLRALAARGGVRGVEVEAAGAAGVARKDALGVSRLDKGVEGVGGRHIAEGGRRRGEQGPATGGAHHLGKLPAGHIGEGAEGVVRVARDDALGIGRLDQGVERGARRHIGEVPRGRVGQRDAVGEHDDLGHLPAGDRVEGPEGAVAVAGDGAAADEVADHAVERRTRGPHRQTGRRRRGRAWASAGRRRRTWTCSSSRTRRRCCCSARSAPCRRSRRYRGSARWPGQTAARRPAARERRPRPWI